MVVFWWGVGSCSRVFVLVGCNFSQPCVCFGGLLFLAAVCLFWRGAISCSRVFVFVWYYFLQPCVCFGGVLFLATLGLFWWGVVSCSRVFVLVGCCFLRPCIYFGRVQFFAAGYLFWSICPFFGRWPRRCVPYTMICYPVPSIGQPALNLLGYPYVLQHKRYMVLLDPEKGYIET